MRPLSQACDRTPGSEPRSGVRARAASVDFDSFARTQLQHTGRWARELRVPEQDVEELLQDAFVVMLEKGSTVRPELLGSWFRGVLHNKMQHFARAKAVATRFEPLLRAHLAGPASACATPDADVVRREVLSVVFWLVEQVHESRREVVERYVFDDEPLAEIAEAMNEPPGTVFARWERGKADMRRALERERHRRGAERWWILVGALVETLRVALLLNGRRINDAITALRARALPRAPESSPLASAKQSRHRSASGPSGALVACAAVLLGMSSHVSLDVPQLPVVALATSFDASAGFKGKEGAVDVPAAQALPRGAGTSFPSAPKDNRAADALPAAELRDLRRPPPRGASSTAADLEMARLLILQAATSANMDVARGALRRYRRLFPEDPFPALHQRAKQREHTH
jgi:RNA polymerase sigma factor (sigma-70 family)